MRQKTEPEEFSGRLSLRIPKSLHRDLALRARAEGVNLNKFAVAAFAVTVKWTPGARIADGVESLGGLEIFGEEGETEYEKPAALVEAERASLRRSLGFP